MHKRLRSDGQWLPAGRQDPDPRTRLQQSPHEAGARVKEVLAIVEEQE